MEEHIKHDIKDVLKNALSAIRKEDIKALRALSDMTIHNASIHQDRYSTTVSILIYSLSKLYGRTRYEGYKKWGAFCIDCEKKLQDILDKLEDNDEAGFEKGLKEYISVLKKSGGKLKKHIQDVFHKASINKGSRIYEHGISVGRTAEMLGVSEYELMDYVGKTYIADVKENYTIAPKQRMQTARQLFK